MSGSMSTDKFVFLNNTYIKETEAKVSIFDRGFLFADGVYEVLPVYNNTALFLTEHLQRLQSNLDLLKINYSVAYDPWKGICSHLITLNGPNRPIYIQITRGCENTRNHDYSENIQPTLVAFSLKPIILGSCLSSAPVKVITLPDNRWNNCNIKSIALLGNILLRQEGRALNAEEVLLIRPGGNIVEGTTSNYFIVKNNTILTPPLNNEILPGITRQIILEICRSHNIQLLEKHLSLADIYAADEVWLSSSTKEIRPVGQVNDTIIHNNKPGPMWQQIANLYVEHIQQKLITA